MSQLVLLCEQNFVRLSDPHAHLISGLNLYKSGLSWFYGFSEYFLYLLPTMICIKVIKLVIYC